MQDRIVRFLQNAKRNTYAAKGPQVSPSRPCSHDFNFRENDLLYIDTYLGGESFAGEEAVWLEGSPIWSMNYCGRVLDLRFDGDFLKRALLQVPADCPYRGPQEYREGETLYRCAVSGVPEWFQGHEEILIGQDCIYECYFHGGEIG